MTYLQVSQFSPDGERGLTNECLLLMGYDTYLCYPERSCYGYSAFSKLVAVVVVQFGVDLAGPGRKHKFSKYSELGPASKLDCHR